MTCSSRIIPVSEMLPEIHAIENCYFLKPIIPDLQIREGVEDSSEIITCISQ